MLLRLKEISIYGFALAMEKIFRDTGAPEGVFTNLFVTYEQSDRLVADPRIKGITRTGSTEVIGYEKSF